MLRERLRLAARQMMWRLAFSVAGLAALVVALAFATGSAHALLSRLVDPAWASAIVALVYVGLAGLCLKLGRGPLPELWQDQKCPARDEERAAQLLESFLAGQRLGRRLSARETAPD